MSLNLSLTSPAGSEPAGLQWTVTHPNSITGVSVTAGPAAVSAGKSISCMSTLSGYSCILSGSNGNTIANGVIATIALPVSASATGTLAIGLNNVIGASAAGGVDTISGVAGSIVVSAPAPAPVTVTGVACNPAVLTSGGAASCTITLSGAAGAGGVIVPVSSSSALLSVPASVTVAAGAASGNFTATAGTVSSNQPATVIATLNGSSQSASISLTAVAAVTALQCTPANLGANASTTCTVTISQAAPAGGTAVTISDNSAALTTPASVTVAGGAVSANFAATTGALSAAQSVTVTASLNGSSQSVSVSLAPALAISALQCAAASIPMNTATSCTVTLSQAAPSGGVTVTIAENSAALSTPSSVQLAASGTTATFAAAAGSVASDQMVTITASFNGSSKTFNLQIQAAPTVTSLQCAATSLTANSSTTCTVTISKAAPSGGVSVAISDNAISVSTPASVTVAAGAVSATFSASAAAGSASQTSIASSQSVTITASLNASSQSASLTLSLVLTISSLQCSPSTVPPNGGTACTITLTGSAPSGGTALSIASTSAILTVPASAMVPAGASTATFIATAGPFATNQSATISAAMGTATSSSTIALTVGASPDLHFLLHGISKEAAGTSNGAVVTPSIGPSGFTGALVVNGSGSVHFTTGSGVYFQNCCSNTNNAYYHFTGSTVGKVFNINQGQVTFYVTSRYSFAQRQATASGQRYAFDVRDANGHLFSFMAQVASNALQFTYTIAGSTQYYFVPQGTEDQLFGAGVTLKVGLTWDGSTAKLYLNGTAVKSTKYTPPVPNWSSASMFDIGAYEYLTYGGYDSSDDLIGEFGVTNPALLQINGDHTEVSGLTNGSAVTPSAGPAGFAGSVVVKGTGSVNFTAGSGVYFLNCCSNTNNAYYHFAGAALGSIFNVAQGQVSFYLTSRYSFAQRQTSAAAARYAFDVRDGNGTHLFYFMTQVVSGSLQFTYMAAGSPSVYYFVPKGTEDQLYGSGVTLKVTLKWDGTNVYLYLNDTLIKTTAYIPPTPSWTAASMFDLGAYEYMTYGGYNSSDDLIRGFTVPAAQ